MNKRNAVVIKSMPICSTGMVYANISLPCEPWLQPTILSEKPTASPKTDHELMIVEAITTGHTVFNDIVTVVFGLPNSSTEDRARAIMLDMLSRGILKRNRTITLSGNPYIWEIASGS